MPIMDQLSFINLFFILPDQISCMTTRQKTEPSVSMNDSVKRKKTLCANWLNNSQTKSDTLVLFIKSRADVLI